MPTSKLEYAQFAYLLQNEYIRRKERKITNDTLTRPIPDNIEENQ